MTDTTVPASPTVTTADQQAVPDRPDTSPRPGLTGVRVLLTATHYPPEDTTPAAFCAQAARYLADRGAQVRVLTVREPREADGTDGIRSGGDVVRTTGHGARTGRHTARPARHGVRTCGDGPEVVRAGRPTQDAGAWGRAVQHLGYLVGSAGRAVSFRPDVVVASLPALAAAGLGVTAARIAGVPCITVVHGLVNGSDGRPVPGTSPLAARLLSGTERWILRHGTHVTIPSPAFAPAVRAVAPGVTPLVVPNWTVLPPADDDGTAPPGPDPEQVAALRRDLGWGDRFVIAHVGPLGARQAPAELAPSLHHLAVAQPQALVAFVGDGPHRAALEEATVGLSSVQVRGPVAPEELPLVLRAADVLLVHESSATARTALPDELTACFAAGRPVLAVVRPDSATAAEVTRRDAGMLVRPHDPTALADAVARLYTHPLVRARLGEAGRAYAAQALHPAHTLDRLGLIVARAVHENQARHRVGDRS